MDKSNKGKNNRCCVSCHKIAPKTDFFRVIRQNDNGNITLHHTVGRSAYICKNVECLAIAEKKNV